MQLGRCPGPCHLVTSVWRADQRPAQRPESTTPLTPTSRERRPPITAPVHRIPGNSPLHRPAKYRAGRACGPAWRRPPGPVRVGRPQSAPPPPPPPPPTDAATPGSRADVPSRAVPSRAVPCCAVPCRAVLRRSGGRSCAVSSVRFGCDVCSTRGPGTR